MKNTNIEYINNIINEPLSMQRNLLFNLLINFTERESLGKYDPYELSKYDLDFKGILTLCNRYYNNETNSLSKKRELFIKNISYQGKIYRIMRNGSIEWNDVACSWSKKYDYRNFTKVNEAETYTFIVANTYENIGIDVNKSLTFLQGHPNENLAYENEIIFPMNEYNVEQIYTNITAEQFYNLMNTDK